MGRLGQTSIGFTHGYSGYVNYRCRCEVCTDANRVFMAGLRARGRQRRLLAEAEGKRHVASGQVTHGTAETYSTYGCRCDECRAAKSTRDREWRARKPRKSADHPHREVAGEAPRHTGASATPPVRLLRGSSGGRSGGGNLMPPEVPAVDPEGEKQ